MQGQHNRQNRDHEEGSSGGNTVSTGTNRKTHGNANAEGAAALRMLLTDAASIRKYGTTQ